MGRTTDEVIDALPKARRKRVLARYRALKMEVENLRKKRQGKQKNRTAAARNVDYIIRKLAPAQRKKVEARAAELIAEEMALRELRRARKLTQVKIAKKAAQSFAQR